MLKEQFSAVLSAAFGSYIKSYRSVIMTKDETVVQFVNILKDLENKLASIGHTVPNEEKRCSLLRGLCEEFNNVASMIREPEEDRSAALGILVTKEATLNLKKDVAERGSALYVDNGKWTHSGMTNHTNQNCWENTESNSYHPKCQYGKN